VLDPYSVDYDCEGGSGDGRAYTGQVDVVGDDPYGLDRDGDGIAAISPPAPTATRHPTTHPKALRRRTLDRVVAVSGIAPTARSATQSADQAPVRITVTSVRAEASAA
jgi:hypothetical protein